MHTHKQINQWNNTKMSKNTTFHSNVKSEPGGSPKYPEYVFSGIGLSLCRQGFDHKLRQITNCDGSVAICDLSQFVIKAVTAQTESNNIENVFCVLGRVPMFTFDMNMKTYIFADSGVISLVYLLCVCISVIKPIIDVQRKPSW